MSSAFCQHMLQLETKEYITLFMKGCGILFQPQLDPIIVGQVIAKFRVSKGMTQEVLSGFADIARGHLAMIERGERKPTLETLYRISTALDIPMAAIVEEIELELHKKIEKSKVENGGGPK